MNVLDYVVGGLPLSEDIEEPGDKRREVGCSNRIDPPDAGMGAQLGLRPSRRAIRERLEIVL